MNTADLDIVYFVKEWPTNEELRLSLRSVCANMAHKRVWIFGGCPKNICPDIYVKAKQTGKNKWDNVRKMFLMACNNKELTEDFVLFNDDFYIMKPTDHIDPLYRCSLDEHIKILETNFNNKPSEYSRLLRTAKEDLEYIHRPTLSYELHTPFIFNKKKLLYILEKFPDWHCTRTIYGNAYFIGGKKSSDVKIFSSKTELDYKNFRFLSTDDTVVNVNNDIWRYIRGQFKQKCEYEN